MMKQNDTANRAVRFTAFLFATITFAATASAGLFLHTTFDNEDVGGSLGADSSANGRCQIRDTAGLPQNGFAQNVLSGGATADAHVTSGAPGTIGTALGFPSSVFSNRGVTFGDVGDVATGDLTAGIWLDPLETSGIQVLASKGNLFSPNEGWTMFLQDGVAYARIGLGGAAPLARASMSDNFVAGQ